MVSGISSAASAVDAAYARFDRAAGNVVAATNPDTGGDTGDMAAAIVEMDASKLAVAASLMLMRKSNDILVSAINMGGYGTSVDG